MCGVPFFSFTGGWGVERWGSEMLPLLPSAQVWGSPRVLPIKVRVVYKMLDWPLRPWPDARKIIETSRLFPGLYLSRM